MSKIWFILSAALLLQASRACDDHPDDHLAAARDDTAEYLANAYGYGPGQMWDPYYQSSSRIPGYINQYEGRSPMNRQPSTNNIQFKNYFNRNNIDDGNQPEGRFGLSGLGAQILNAGFFNNRFPTGLGNRPLVNFANRLPISINPNFANPIAAFDSCTAPSGESGICAPGAVCSLFGGRPSGSCLLGGVCCINAVTTCGGTITLNNTYWQSPSTPVSSSSTCSLTVKLDTKLVEQKKSICQVRLDFVSFTLEQPSAVGDCVDTFRVGGAINQVPAICGVNSGQHMYLHVPPSDTNPTDLQLMMNFGAATLTRTWNIKISMLPCGASYTAPSDCLQYFTSATGRVSSFNWQNVVAAGTRQLNNQQYNICFRNELIDSQRTTQICLQVCTPVVAGGDAFSLSGNVVGDTGSVSGTAAGAAGCLLDFLLFQNGGNTAAGVTTSADRYCGSALNPTVAVGGGASVPVCSTIRPFRITYVTSVDEVTAPADANNQGFCLTFQQSVQ